MPALKPEHGYRYALSVPEIVGRMIDFDEEANDLPFHEVLDCWVEQAESQYERAQRKEESIEALNDFKAEINRRKAVRGDAIAMHNELNTAAAEIAQGHDHPYLVLARTPYAPGLPEFTIKSLYIWAMESRGKIIPEWAPSATGTTTTILVQPSPAAAAIDEPDRGWAEVLIQLLPGGFIGHSISGNKMIMTPLSETGFVDKRIKATITTNQSFEVLCGLADAGGFGAGRVATGRDKARKDKICRALADLVGMEGDPFSGRSPREGYRPHFTVEDKRHDAVERAKRNFYREDYDSDHM